MSISNNEKYENTSFYKGLDSESINKMALMGDSHSKIQPKTWATLNI